MVCVNSGRGAAAARGCFHQSHHSFVLPPYPASTAAGALLAFAWLVLLPGGILIARYSKGLGTSGTGAKATQPLQSQPPAPAQPPAPFWFAWHWKLQVCVKSGCEMALEAPGVSSQAVRWHWKLRCEMALEAPGVSSQAVRWHWKLQVCVKSSYKGRTTAPVIAHLLTSLASLFLASLAMCARSSSRDVPYSRPQLAGSIFTLVGVVLGIVMVPLITQVRGCTS
jgi:hypothetical protein